MNRVFDSFSFFFSPPLPCNSLPEAAERALYYSELRLPLSIALTSLSKRILSDIVTKKGAHVLAMSLHIAYRSAYVFIARLSETLLLLR